MLFHRSDPRSLPDSHPQSSVSSGDNRPPLVPFVLSVGVTGHRADVFGEGDIERLGERVRHVLLQIEEAACALLERERDCFAPAPARLRLVSPIADGADQIAAQIALDLGWELQAILPFARDRYRASLANHGARERFDELLGRSTCTLELPGDSEAALEAYVMTGRATIAHSDLLLAVWDGQPPRGRGGTGEVVQVAIVKGTPVLHLPLSDSERPRLMWSAFDPAVVTQELDEAVSRPFDREFLDQVLNGLFAPPDDAREREFLATYAHERLRSVRARIEYPLLLAAAGVKPIRKRDFRDAPCAQEIRDEWASYREYCAERHEIDPSLDVLELAYSCSDRLATHFAQTYRSGHVFNFVLGGLAVCVGLMGNILNRDLLELALAEGSITAAILINTRLGVKCEWHRRWLDYRQLAERLRPMRSLKLLGIAAPDPPGSATNPVARRWIDWYAAGVWRAMGCPSGRLDKERVTGLAEAIAEFELAPQVSYHRRHAHQIDLLDERLEKIAASLFWTTLIVSVLVVVGLAIMPDAVMQYDPWFDLIGAGFPALGTAVFGIRFQGDFGGSAVRSLAAANALEQIEMEMRGVTRLQRASDLTEQAARTMLVDLEEWRLVNQQQELDLL